MQIVVSNRFLDKLKELLVTWLMLPWLVCFKRLTKPSLNQ